MDLEYELQLFHTLRVSELEAEENNKKKQRFLNLMSDQLLDCLSVTIIQPCLDCKGSKDISLPVKVPLNKNSIQRRCFHWYPEDLYTFWKLRVCNKWKDIIDDWLSKSPIILIYGKLIKGHDLTIIEDVWSVEKYPTELGFERDYFTKELRSAKRPLWNSIKWYQFLLYVEAKYGIKTNRSECEAPICNEFEANTKLVELESRNFRREYKRRTKEQRKTAGRTLK